MPRWEGRSGGELDHIVVAEISETGILRGFNKLPIEMPVARLPIEVLDSVTSGGVLLEIDV